MYKKPLGRKAMSKTQEFKHKTKQDTKNIGDYLHNLAEGIEKGTINLDNGVEQLVMRPSGIMEMELKTKIDGEKCKLELEIKWIQSKNRPLSISTEEA
jgi:amphi-Trp domain-containing protein